MKFVCVFVSIIQTICVITRMMHRMLICVLTSEMNGLRFLKVVSQDRMIFVVMCHVSIDSKRCERLLMSATSCVANASEGVRRGGWQLGVDQELLGNHPHEF